LQPGRSLDPPGFLSTMPDDLTARLDALIATQQRLTDALAALAHSLGLLAQAIAADDEADEAGLPATLDG
jgi:hypothetical protein